MIRTDNDDILFPFASSSNDFQTDWVVSKGTALPVLSQKFGGVLRQNTCKIFSQTG